MLLYRILLFTTSILFILNSVPRILLIASYSFVLSLLLMWMDSGWTAVQTGVDSPVATLKFLYQYIYWIYSNANTIGSDVFMRTLIALCLPYCCYKIFVFAAKITFARVNINSIISFFRRKKSNDIDLSSRKSFSSGIRADSQSSISMSFSSKNILPEKKNIK